MSFFAVSAGLDRFWMLAASLALDAILPRSVFPFGLIPHPVRWIGRLADSFEGRFNRPCEAATSRRLMGIACVAILVVMAVALALAVQSIGRSVPYGWVLELAFATSLFAQRSLFSHVAGVVRPLKIGDLDGARRAVAEIVGRDPERLDRHAIARAAIESLAENFSDAVVAPALAYAFFGLPGLFVYKTVNTLDSMWGHRSERFAAFGFAAARLDDVLNFIPARLSGAVIAFAAFAIPKAQFIEAWRSMARDAAKHRSINAGWPESAMAGALDLAIAGPRHYGAQLVDDSWMGRGRTEAEPADIGRALALYATACLVLWLGVLAAAGMAT